MGKFLKRPQWYDTDGTLRDAAKITLNGSVNQTPTFYAPTSIGTSGQVLVSYSTGYPPYWQSLYLHNVKLYIRDSGQIANETGYAYFSLFTNSKLELTVSSTNISNVPYNYSGKTVPSSGYLHIGSTTYQIVALKFGTVITSPLSDTYITTYTVIYIYI